MENTSYSGVIQNISVTPTMFKYISTLQQSILKVINYKSQLLAVMKG